MIKITLYNIVQYIYSNTVLNLQFALCIKNIKITTHWEGMCEEWGEGMVSEGMGGEGLSREGMGEKGVSVGRGTGVSVRARGMRE